MRVFLCTYDGIRLRASADPTLGGRLTCIRLSKTDGIHR